MSSLLTKGGLTPGKLIDLNDNKEVKFMFNPFEYTLSKSTSWNETEQTGTNVPETTFKSGSAMSLSVTLYFDTLDTRTTSGTYTSVRDHTKNLWAMMLIDESQENTESGKSEPPIVAFEWGEVYFKSVIKSMSEKLTLFSETGTPLRAEVQLSLEQYFDPADTPAQVPNQPSWTTTAPKTSTFTAGQRMDLMVSAAMSATSTAVRQVCAANNIDNPLNIPNGQHLLMG